MDLIGRIRWFRKNHPFNCFYCGVKLSRANRTLDHVVPRSKGGASTKENKVPCCRPCNELKADLKLGTFLHKYRQKDWGMRKFKKASSKPKSLRSSERTHEGAFSADDGRKPCTSYQPEGPSCDILSSEEFEGWIGL